MAISKKRSTMTTERALTLKQQLQKARGYIARGWCKKSYFVLRDGRRWFDIRFVPSPIVACCAAGAIYRAQGARDNETPLHRALVKALNGSAYLHLPMFNDAPGRRKRDVLRLYDRAIKACDG